MSSSSLLRDSWFHFWTSWPQSYTAGPHTAVFVQLLNPELLSVLRSWLWFHLDAPEEVDIFNQFMRDFLGFYKAKLRVRHLTCWVTSVVGQRWLRINTGRSPIWRAWSRLGEPLSRHPRQYCNVYHSPLSHIDMETTDTLHLVVNFFFYPLFFLINNHNRNLASSPILCESLKLHLADLPDPERGGFFKRKKWINGTLHHLSPWKDLFQLWK